MQVSTASGVQPVALQQAHGVEEVGEQQPVHHEAGGVGDLDSRLAERLAELRAAASRVSSVAAAREDSSTSFILVTGLNTCRPTKRSGRPLRLPRARATESDEVVVARMASPGEHVGELRRAAPRLRRHVLGDRLDDDGAAGSSERSVTDASQRSLQLRAPARSSARAARCGPTGPPVADLAAAARREPAGDRPAARYPEPSFNAVPSSGCWLTGQSMRVRFTAQRERGGGATQMQNGTRSRGRHRRGGPHPDRARSPGEGLLQGHPPERRCSARPTPRSSSAPGSTPSEVEDVDHRLRAAVRRAGFNIGRNAWLAGRAADRDAGDHRRPPVRLRPAGRQLRRRADRLRRPRRRHRRRRRAHGPHLRSAIGFKVGGRASARLGRPS